MQDVELVLSGCTSKLVSNLKERQSRFWAIASAVEHPCFEGRLNNPELCLDLSNNKCKIAARIAWI
jgi:hypothetical protein